MEVKMKVLQITKEIFPNQLGGVGKHVHDLSMELIRNGVEVKLLVRNFRPNSKLSDSVHLANELNKIKEYVIVYNSLLDVYRLISTHRFDIIHFHQLGPRPLGYLQNEIIQVLAKGVGAKIVNTPHGALDVLTNPPSVESTRYSKIAMKCYLGYLKNMSLKLVNVL